ncbi:Aquaporin-2 [Hondaea fermentalgiana]|uniref:Aquaporin-2 n=1 Tax=Hondaea fermentalgiana TaxID=2315210 RepID=A0A2R5GGK4_9STRA|nr:Aquaporin-2 [Hondaea fermentalgiana]|eukprot:GBG30036.1 Aquaporin-2 [Hondaea fermentalgiana]
MAKQDVVDARFVKDVLVELLAMTLFIWIGTGSAVSTGEFLALSDAPNQKTVARILPIAFAFGIGILVLVYAFGHVSGGHIK